MTLKIGADFKLYYNTGTDASPTWVLVEIVGDVTVPLSLSTAEIKLRASSWDLGLPARHSAGFEFFLANDIDGTEWEALRGYFFSKTVVQYASTNGAIAASGVEYFSAFAHFEDFPWDQPLSEVSSHACKLALSYQVESGSLIEPSWNVVP